MRFLANENFPLPSVQRLRQAGHDVSAISEISPGVKDFVVLSRASEEQRIVLTFDRDYGELIYRLGLPAPFGVIYFRFDPLTPEEPAEQLLRLLSLPGVSLEQKFTVVERGQLRQRALPENV
jgi:predicted nuclease of predicted toxin-antitoxin system